MLDTMSLNSWHLGENRNIKEFNKENCCQKNTEKKNTHTKGIKSQEEQKKRKEQQRHIVHLFEKLEKHIIIMYIQLYAQVVNA